MIWLEPNPTTGSAIIEVEIYTAYFLRCVS